MRKWLKITGLVWLGLSMLLLMLTIAGLILQSGRPTDQLLYLRTTANLSFGMPFDLMAVDPQTMQQQFSIRDNSAVHTMDGHPPILSANRLRWYFVTKDSIIIVNSLTGEKVRTLPLRDSLTINVGQGYYIAAQDISPDDQWYYQVYVSSPNDPHSMLIRLFSLKTGHALPQLIKLPSYCWAIIQVKMNVYARCDNSFKAIDLDTQHIGADVPLPIAEVDTGAVAILPDNKLAYMKFGDTDVIIYDQVTKTILHTLTPNPALPKFDAATASSPNALSAGVDLQVSRDGSKLIMITFIYNHSGLDHEQINLFDLRTWAASPAYVTRSGFSTLEFSANGSTMLAVLEKQSDQDFADTYIEMNTESGKVRQQYTRPHEEIENIFLVP